MSEETIHCPKCTSTALCWETYPDDGWDVLFCIDCEYMWTQDDDENTEVIDEVMKEMLKAKVKLLTGV